MSDVNDDVQRLSPDRLMTAFSRSHIALCLIIAIALHVVVVAATSVSYIHDTWIDPEGAEQRRVEDERQLQEALAAARRDRDARRKAAARATTRPDRRADDVPDRVRNSAIYKATTQSADPSEIPKEPEGMALPFE